MTDSSYRLLSAEFICSAPSIQTLPSSSLPEAAFVGRSNVGKSTLLNAVAGVKTLARTSKTPGRTQEINYFRIRVVKGRKEDGIKEAHFVDLPGYGYAQVAKSKQKQWAGVLEQYITQRYNLALVVLLLDARREPGEEERWFTHLGKEGSLLVAFTKTDKLGRNELVKRREQLIKELQLDPQQVVFTSAAHRKEGINELTQAICQKLFG